MPTNTKVNFDGTHTNIYLLYVHKLVSSLVHNCMHSLLGMEKRMYYKEEHL